MKTLAAFPFIFASAGVFAADQCASPAQQTVPSAQGRTAGRSKPKSVPMPVVGPKLHLTPYVPVRPFAKPSRSKFLEAASFNCITPVSLPPGAIRVGHSIPYVGLRPEWGTPSPTYLALGPLPVRPGSPDDFMPATYLPPAAVPPAGTELPEPSTIALMLLGISFLLGKRRPAQ